MGFFKKIIDNVARMFCAKPSQNFEAENQKIFSVIAARNEIMEIIAPLGVYEKLALHDSTILSSTIGHTPWFQHSLNDHIHLPFHDECFATDVKNLMTLYSSLETRIMDAKTKAEDSGKPLLIMLGEHHYNRNSLLIEFLVMDIALKCGINTFLDEKSPSVSTGNKPHDGSSHIKEASNFPNDLYFNLLPSFSQFTDYRPIDVNWSKEYPVFSARLNDRDKGMKTELAKVKSHALGVWGTGHLDSLSQADALEPFEVLAFDLTQGLSIYNHERQFPNDHYVQMYNNRLPETGWVDLVMVPGRGVERAYDALNLAQDTISEVERQKAGIPENGFVSKVEKEGANDVIFDIFDF